VLGGKRLGAGGQPLPNHSSASIRPSRCHHEGHHLASERVGPEEGDVQLCLHYA